MAPQADLLPGTLDLLILKAVSLGPQHGYGVLLRIEQISGGALAIEQGALYPALYRLEHQGLLDTDWGASDNNRRAKFYRLTPAGRRWRWIRSGSTHPQLAAMALLALWAVLSAGMLAVTDATSGEILLTALAINTALRAHEA